MRYTTIFVAALAIVAGRVAAQDDTTDTADATDTATNDVTDTATNDVTATDTANGADATPTGIPACATTCGQQSTAQSTCASKTDVSCLCNDESFINAVAQCITTSCSEADQAAAANFADEFCANAGPVTASASSAVPTTPVVATSRPAATSAAASHAATARSSVSQSIRSSASVVGASASASHSGNAATAVKMPSASMLTLGATVLGFVVGPLLLFA